MFIEIFIIAIMALTIWREARGEPEEGKLAVAYVIMNRSKDPSIRWPTDPIGVITQPLQFSSITYKGDNQLTLYPKARDAYGYIKIAFQAYYGLVPDPTHGSNHYHAIYVNPSWADPLKLQANIGNHKFYKL